MDRAEREPLLRVSGRPQIPTPTSSSTTTALFQYYDPAAIFNLQPDVVLGYYTLLGGRPEVDLTVAYFAILDGNVLPSVFGLSPLAPIAHTGGVSGTRAFLSGFQGDDAQERRIVFAYATLFRLLQQYHHDMRAACWCFPPCAPCARSCLRGRYQRSTLRAIDATFLRLEKDLTPA